jgi:hypothetical protein
MVLRARLPTSAFINPAVLMSKTFMPMMALIMAEIVFIVIVV